MIDGQPLTIPLVIGAGLIDSLNPCAFALLMVFIASMVAMIQRQPGRAGEGQARRWLVPIASGRLITTLAFSERGTGAHFYNPEIQARRNGGYVLSGTKSFVNMIELEGREIPENEVADAIEFGHKAVIEIVDMIGWVRPKIVIPVHGEALHLAEHAKLARSAGVPHVLVCRNGDLVRLGAEVPRRYL